MVATLRDPALFAAWQRSMPQASATTGGGMALISRLREHRPAAAVAGRARPAMAALRSWR
jgi:hypothetical protein